MLAKSWELLNVNSAKAQWILMFGSEGLATLGSTKPGPGLSRKVKGCPIENQIRPPAMWGITALTVLPGPPSGMETLAPSEAPGALGDVGKYGVLPSAWRRKRALLLSMARPVMYAKTVPEELRFWRAIVRVAMIPNLINDPLQRWWNQKREGPFVSHKGLSVQGADVWIER